MVEQFGSGMSRILKVHDKSIFAISEHFIKIEFPFFVSKDNQIITIGDEIGNDNGEGGNLFIVKNNC